MSQGLTQALTRTRFSAKTIAALAFLLCLSSSPAMSLDPFLYHWTNNTNHLNETIVGNDWPPLIDLQGERFCNVNPHSCKEFLYSECPYPVGYSGGLLHILCHGYYRNDGRTEFNINFYSHRASCPSGAAWNPSTSRCECSGGGSYSLEAPHCPSYNEENACSSCPSETGNTNPINLGVGNKYHAEIDYIGNGAFPLTVTRIYNYITARWQFFSELIVNAEQTQIQVVRPDGKKLELTSDAAGNWAGPPYVTGTLTKIVDGSGNVTGWRYKTLEGDTEDYRVDGRILRITNQQGIRHTYSWNTRSVYVTRSLGGRLVYNTTYLPGTYIFHITSFVDPNTNETITYTRNGNDLITGINYPNGGGTRTYHYENTRFPGALIGITDANGDRFATWAYDAEGRAISSEYFGGAEKVTVDYAYLNDPSDPRAVATNALGKQTTYHFTTIYGVRKVIQVEGHPSPNCAAANKNYTYDTNGFVASKTDWKGNTTTYVRNSKGQELSLTEATGTPQARTITTEWHPTFNLRTKVTEPDRETTYIYDANGNMVGQQIVDRSVS